MSAVLILYFGIGVSVLARAISRNRALGAAEVLEAALWPGWALLLLYGLIFGAGHEETRNELE